MLKGIAGRHDLSNGQMGSFAHTYKANVLAKVAVMGCLSVTRARHSYLASMPISDAIYHGTRAQADHDPHALSMHCASLSLSLRAYKWSGT